jgi:hypothetical protein
MLRKNHPKEYRSLTHMVTSTKNRKTISSKLYPPRVGNYKTERKDIIDDV